MGWGGRRGGRRRDATPGYMHGIPFPRCPLPPPLPASACPLFCRHEQELQDLAHQKWLYVQKHEETLAKVCMREGGMDGEKIAGRDRGVAKVCVYDGGRQAGQ